MDRPGLHECGGKRQHADRQSAKGHLASLKQAGAAAWRISIYRCRHCRTWHVGHRPKPRKNRR